MAFPIFMVCTQAIEIHICDRMSYKFNGQYSERKNRPAICARNETKKIKQQQHTILNVC